MNKKNQLVKKPVSVLVSKQRVVEVAAMLLNFKSRRYIIDELTSKYGIAQRSCDAIITRAYQYIKDNYKTDRESVIITHLEFYYDLAQEWKTVDPRASLKALEQIEKLLKLHQDVPLIQQNTLNLNFEKISTEELLKAIDNIKQGKKDA
jgi:hypothetical protein